MKTILKILKWVGIIILALVLILFISGAVLYNKKYEAPLPDMHASSDSAVIEHGKHLVIATAHCVECHFKPGDSLKANNGEEVELAGGAFPFEFPGGVFYSKNISSDKETGIGNLTDEQIARVMRHGVKHDGSVLIPAMEFQNMSDEDVTSIISYLRTTKPVNFKVPENDFNLLGLAVVAFILRPEGPKATPPLKVTPDSTVEYGRYIAESVSSCRGCHTERDRNTGKYIGEELAGGSTGTVPNDPTRILIAPNLTPDPKTGRIYNWDFDHFKTRFSQGKLIPESVMPWGQFKHLNEIELIAIWKYLHSLKPVEKENGATLQAAK